MAKFAPLHDRILVRRVEEAATTRGGIIIPDSAKDKPQEGEVISTGKGRTNDEGKTFPLAVKEVPRILTGAAAPAKKELAGSKKKLSAVSSQPSAKAESDRHNWSGVILSGAV